MGQAQAQAGDALLGRDLRRPSVQHKLWCPSTFAGYLQLAPSDPAADPGSERLGTRLLGRKARGEAFRGALAGLAVGDLARGIDPLEELPPTAEAAE